MATDTSKIIQLNARFYDMVAEDFARSRIKPWKGWERVLPYFRSGNVVTDLGCGDGRFFGYLKSRGVQVCYIGYDSCESLINMARLKHPETSFVFSDIYTVPLNRINDIVVAFGLLHHIPNKITLNNVFNNIAQSVKVRGTLIFTVWRFDPSKEKTFNHKARELGITLEENDYLLDWGGSGENLRFCHLYHNDEVSLIMEMLSNTGFSLAERYMADRYNEYFVFTKKV